MKSMIKVVLRLLLACSITACIVFGAHASELAAEAARVSRAERLYEAIVAGRGEKVEALLNAKADVNAIIYDESMIEHACASNKSYRMLKLLLDYKANVNAASKVDGGTVLHRECDTTNWWFNDEYVEIALILLKHGAAVNARDIHGNTPLAYHINSMLRGSTPSQYKHVHLLFEWGANPNIGNNAGETILGMIRVVLASSSSDYYRKLRAYTVLSALADHRKTLNALEASLPFSEQIVALVADYSHPGSKHAVNKAKLAALVAEFKGELERYTGRKDLLL